MLLLNAFLGFFLQIFFKKNNKNDFEGYVKNFSGFFPGWYLAGPVAMRQLCGSEHL